MKHFVSCLETLRSAPVKHFVSRYETLCFAGMKQCVSGQESEDETLLPDVSLCVFVEYGIFSDAVPEKCFPDVLLLSRFHIGLVAVDAVVFGSPEVAQDFGFDAFGLFLWQGVEQVLQAKLEGQENPTVSLHCDKTVAIDEAVKMMNLSYEHGYRLILATTPN